MATRSFAINTEPHTAVIGEHTLSFKPEVNGAEFATAYRGLNEAQKRIKEVGQDNVGTDELLDVNKALRDFLSAFMLPQSAALFESLSLPDRILAGLVEFVSEVYAGNARGGSSPASS